MQIKLKSLIIASFKGLQNKTFNFSENINTIFGDNGTGKTTIFDAFMWLLFSKDSLGRADFEIKPLDVFGKTTDNQNVEVAAELLIDEEVITVQKILKEKWTKKRGSEIAEFTGNETLYFFNDVPVSQKEYLNKINNIINENVFKLITNPFSFVNSKWQEQRTALIGIANIPNDKQIALGNTELENLLNEVGTQKTLEEFQVQLKSSIKRAKEEKNSIPSRIEELNRSKPIPIVEGNIKKQIDALTLEVNSIDETISNKMKSFDEVIAKRNQNQSNIQDLQAKINQIEFNIKEEAKRKANEKNPVDLEYNSTKKELNQLELEHKTILDKIDYIKNEIAICQKNRDELRNYWFNVNDRKFNLTDKDTICSTCGQELKDIESKKETLLITFNETKKRELKQIEQKGNLYKISQESYEKNSKELENTLNSISQNIESLNKKLTELTPALKNKKAFNAEDFIATLILNHHDFNELKKQIKILEEIKFETPTEEVTADLKTKKETLNAEIIRLNVVLKDNDRIKEISSRITELSEQEKTQNQNIASLERKLFLIEKFNTKKINLLNDSVNKIFSLIKFKLFDIQINEGIKETCEATINGVPFSSANTASKINAGLDIINTLSTFYKVNAPIFIDNKESVVKLIESNSQLICLQVSPEDKILRLV